MALPASSSGLFRFLSPRSRPQSTDIVAAATWGVFAGTAAIYLVQVSLNHHHISYPPRRLACFPRDIGGREFVASSVDLFALSSVSVLGLGCCRSDL
jgi:hypothetical protein